MPGTPRPTHPQKKSGRWTVKRESFRFTVLFHRFKDDQETLLAEFPPTEMGEKQAKTCALHVRNTYQT